MREIAEALSISTGSDARDMKGGCIRTSRVMIEDATLGTYFGVPLSRLADSAAITACSLYSTVR